MLSLYLVAGNGTAPLPPSGASHKDTSHNDTSHKDTSHDHGFLRSSRICSGVSNGQNDVYECVTNNRRNRKSRSIRCGSWVSLGLFCLLRVTHAYQHSSIACCDSCQVAS